MKSTNNPIERKTIDISPHPSIMIKVGQTGYSVQEALSELIDNSLDAREEGKSLKVEVNLSPEKIEVIDNGRGMTEDAATKSLRLGFSNKKDMLGEFGMGLKTSANFLGKHFAVKTSTLDSDEEYFFEFDEEDWLENGSWTNYPFEIIRGIDPGFTGTTVTISKLKISVDDRLLGTIKEELGMRFGPFIKNKEFELIINGKESEPYQPIIIDDVTTKFELEFEGGRVHGWWGYQLGRLNKTYFGFNVYRRGRLVTVYDKVGLDPNQNLVQIIGDIHVEGVPITHDKKSLLKSSEEYKSLQKVLRDHFKPLERHPKRILSGNLASPGLVIGTARRINMFMNANIEEQLGKIDNDTIIVTEMTRPQYLLGIRRSAGIITDLGGTICHAAIVAREFNIPCVVGTQTGTATIVDGQRIILDANGGNVYEF